MGEGGTTTTKKNQVTIKYRNKNVTLPSKVLLRVQDPD